MKLRWNELIGQEDAKERLNFHYDAFVAGAPLPTFYFVAPRGQGKTTIGEAFGIRVREATNGEKRSFTTNAASIKNLKQFWNSIVIPHVNDKDVTILFDEASELPMDVTMFMLSMLAPNPDHVNQVTYDDMTIDYDFRRQTFMFATTESHKVFKPLLDRCRRIDLEDYTFQDLAKIMKRHAKDIEFEDGVLPQVAPTLRGNARQAVHMASDIATYLAPLHKKKFGAPEWDGFRKKLSILPLGINRQELQILELLEQRPDGTPLTRIAANLGLNPLAVQKDLELYLQKRNLMEISTNGRILTAMGYEYLKTLRADFKHLLKRK